MISIIILSWNDRKLVTQSVQSILLNNKHSDVPYECIVIDNASADDSVAMLEQFGDQIRLIKNDHNAGYAGGNNQGYQLAKGDYILLLNQDTIVPPHTISAMAHWLDQHQDYGGVTTKLLNPDNSVQFYMHRRFPTLWSLSLALLHKRWPRFAPKSVRSYLYFDQDFKTDFDIEQAAGACFMVRRSAIAKLGYLFDAKHFPLYYNDVDLSYRLWQAGYKIRCLCNVAITHYKGTSVRKVPRWRNTKIYLAALWNYFFVLRRSAKSSGVK
ncbi:MAG: Glycosyl transferase family 2 [uncultured bacterium]|nr:MAG: Glycosyl transferase family 2 [uncultured bacterium]